MGRMKLLVDYHHADLAHSFALTFGVRFGAEVYHPYGLDWFPEFWAFEQEWHGDAVAKQYLLGIWEGHEPDANGIVLLPDSRHPEYVIKGITLEAARAQGWDLVISSVPTNAPGFSRLARETGARWGIHVGNQWGQEAWELTPDFALLSTTSPIPAGIPHVIVHQEFSLADFHYEPPQGFGPIRSFVNCFPEMQSEYAGNFLPLARAFPEFGWEVYGAYGTAERDEFAAGEIHGTPTIGDAMRGAGAIWHAKHWSDGFGHVIHNAFAVGRPVFGYQRYYEDKLAGPLWVEGVTSYDVENKTDDEVIATLRSLRADPDRYLTMCEAAAARFREVVSFDEDAELIRGLLARVLSEPVAA
jgi:hypothetical protein